MDGSMLADRVIARDDELESVRRFVARVEHGPGVLLLEGEAGVGKTTVWEAGLADINSSVRVLRAQPTEAERSLSFAALSDLVAAEVDEVRGQLPEPQLWALEVALLLRPEGSRSPERRAVAMGLLGVLRALSDAGPLLVAVDDIQWLDAPSASALTFALRRLQNERARVLLTQRLESDDADPLSLDRAPRGLLIERIRIGPLSLAALQRLLRERAAGQFTRPVLRRIHETSGGNPFFALELARALGSRTPDPGQPLPVPDGLRSLVGRRLSGLPSESAEGLLMCALVGQPTTDLLRRGAGGSMSALDSAFEAGVLRVENERVRFTHPLLASAVAEAAGPSQRRDAHRKLADLVVEPEERVRHLALAAEEPDETIAAELAGAARRAARRGAPEIAAELADSALRLTPAGANEPRARRMVDTGAYAWLAGDTAWALRLLHEGVAIAPEGPTRAHALHRLALCENLASDRLSVPGLCREGLAQAGDDLKLRGHLHSVLAWSLLLSRRETAEAVRHARTASQIADQLGDERLLLDCLPAQGQGELLLGSGLPNPAMERALRLHDPDEIRCMRLPAMHAALLYLCADRLDDARQAYGSVLEHATAHGDESGPPFGLMRLTEVELLAGDWTQARAHAAAGHRQAVRSQQPPLEAMLLCTRALVDAHLGAVGEARSQAREGLAAAEPLGDGIGARLALWASGLIELSLGNLEQAADPLCRLREYNRAAGIVEPGENRFLGDLAEALIGLGRLEQAEEVLDELALHARRLDRPAALAVEARCRGLLAFAQGEPALAQASLEDALALHAEVLLPFQHARTLLVLGSVRRGERRRRAARAALEEAAGTFIALGAKTWHQRAANELARIGGRAPSAGALTPSERRVADLVATGLTNREVAAALVVTERTVESHLSHIYRKLEVRSRAELAHRHSPEEGTAKVP